MVRLFVAFALLFTLPPVCAQSLGSPEPLDRDTIRLRFVKPSHLARALSAPERPLLPAGIAEVVPDDRNNTLMVRGTTQALIQVRKAVRLLDLPPRQILLKLRLIRVQFTRNGAGEEETLGTPIRTTVDKGRTMVRLDGPGGNLKVQIVPRVSGDDFITLDTTLSTETQSGRRRLTRTARQTRRVPAGETRRVSGVTDSPDASVQAQVRQGAMPANADVLGATPFTAVYLEVTPLLINDDFYPSAPRP